MQLPRKLAGLAAAGSALVLVLSACAGDEGGGDGDDVATGGFEDCAENPNTCNEGEVQQGGEIRFIINQISSGWNTQTADANSVYSVQANQGILPEISWVQPDGTVNPGSVLTGPPELVSEDPFTWTWQIKEEAVWNDETPITADDFILGWKLLTSDEFGQCVGCNPASTGRSEQIETIEGSPDGKTVTVTLREGQRNPEYTIGAEFNPFPAHVAEAEGFNLDDPESVGEASVWFNETTPTWTGGPWLIESGDFETQVVKVPNPAWYGDPVNLDRIIMVFNTDESTWAQATTNGEIDGGAPSATFPGDVIRQLQAIEGVSVGIGPGGGFEHLDINFENEQLQDVELRRAIFTVIDRQAIAERLYGDLYPEISTSNNYFFRSTDTRPGYYIDQTTPLGYTGDVEAARTILEGAGYQGFNEGEQLTLNGEQIGPFRLRATGTEVRQQSLQLISEYLSQIGIPTEIEPIEDLGAVLVEGDFDIIEFGWSGSAAFAQFPAQMLRSDSDSNFGHFDNAQVDQLVDETANAASLEESVGTANEACAIALQEAFVLPLFEVPEIIWARDTFANIRDNQFDGTGATYHNYGGDPSGWGVRAQ